MLAIISCKSSKSESDKIDIAKRYFKVLDTSNDSDLSELMADSLTTIEGSYTQTYSKYDYVQFLKWDAVFDPNYDILHIEASDGLVIAKISKLDTRISFLNGEAFITNQTLKFHDGKIIQIEIVYENFNETLWGQRKDSLLAWIDKNHPELSGFIYDQTEPGAINYLKAIDLYVNR